MIERVNNRPISRVALICKTLSVLCLIAFFMVALWTIAVLFLVCYSLLSSSLTPEALPLAFAIPIIILLYMANASLIPLVLWRMLKDISNAHTPFTLLNAKRLFRLALILVLYSVLEALLIAVDSQFMLNIGNDSIQVGGFIYDVATHSGTSLDLFPLVIAAIFFALSYVFKYGVLLQQESDETL